MAGNRHTARNMTDSHPLSQDIHGPLDATFILLGILLAGAVIQYGDFQEPRWLQNAWTWLAGIAAGAVIFLLVSRWVSQFWIRRSMQFALLFSLAAHLLLLLAATELWVPAKPWVKTDVPEVEAVVRERQRTTRPDYSRHQFQQAGAQPDFLRPVEAAPPEPTDESLQRPEVTDWTPPELQVEMEWEPEPVTSPSSLRRPEVSETTPRQTENARRISRQTTTREVPLELETVQLDIHVPDDSSDEPPLLAAASAEAVRSDREFVMPSANPPENREVEETLLQERLADAAMRAADRRRSDSNADSPPLEPEAIVRSVLPRRDVGRLSPSSSAAENPPQVNPSSSRSDRDEAAEAGAPIQPRQATLARQPVARSIASSAQPNEPLAGAASAPPTSPLARRPSSARAQPSASGPVATEMEVAPPRLRLGSKYSHPFVGHCGECGATDARE
jgi:hypothetical protein